MSYRLAPAAIVLAAVLGAGASANAGQLDVHNPTEWNTITLKYVDSDIHTVHGARSLAFGIRVAARAVCGGDDPVVRLGGDFPACVETAVDRAVKGLDAPLLAGALGRPARALASLDH
jgi:UrcA family protein